VPNCVSRPAENQSLLYKTAGRGVFLVRRAHTTVMEPNKPKLSGSPGKKTFRWRWMLLLVGCGLTVLLWPRKLPELVPPAASGNSSRPAASPTGAGRASIFPPIRPAPINRLTAEEIVSKKLSQFARSRREYALALARRHNVQMPPDVEPFFAAVESGDWDAIEAAFKKINGGDSSAGHADRAPGVAPLWPAIIDAYGVAEQVHLWPAQKLLDYGNAILNSLRPGMVYVGGTDNGRWIPELLNDTSDGERHIVITQNALADATYQDYLQLQYDDRLANLSDEESQRAFSEYVADAQKRLEHDQQFPDEPKQLLPGEGVRMVDGKGQVAGQTAVMAINEKLLQTLMQKNPDLSFAIQESFPLRSTYADALPLGPLMELNARDGQNTFTVERARQFLDSWRNTADQVLSDPEAPGSSSVLKSYSHDAVAAANLLAAHDFSWQAEEAYRIASTVWPGNPEAINGLAEVLDRTGRGDEAQRLLEDFNRRFPDQRQTVERLRAGWRASVVAPPSAP
jgi:ribosomal protein L16/L10AE